jgi:hypothetical protein
MDAVGRNRRVRAFRAADAFALEAYRVSATLSVARHPELVGGLQRSAIRAGASLVAASASPPGGTIERELLERARTSLMQSRYYLYVARRLALIDVRLYRGLTVRQDAALKELESLLGGESWGVNGLAGYAPAGEVQTMS